VPGAEVTRSVSLVEMFQTAPLRVEADEDGKFLIEDLDAGPVSLTAKAPGYASTTTEVGVMAGGDRREGLDIEVGTGGRLEGSVYGEDGFPMGGGIATAAGPAVGTFLQSVIDDSGRFVVPNLPAGQYQVSALRGSFLADAAGSNPNEMLKGMKIGQAEIVDGKTTTIVLGQETGKLVKVFGRVRSGGGPVANAIVTAIPRTEGGMNAMRFTSTGEDGKFEVKIPPGKVTISVANSRSQTGSEKTLDIPAQATFELDFALPEATIEGTVHGPDGAPLAGQPVLLSREQGNVKTIFGSFGQVQSNDEGKYKFENLDEGDYTIAAGGVHLFADTGMKAFGRVSTIVRVASAEAVRGVDFRLDIAGEITGVVSTAGKPLPAASIFLQTPDGRSVNRLSDVFSNASGSFRARGVAAGTYRLLARARGFASKFIEPVVVETGRETQIQVDLTPGASVTVRVLDKEGKPLPGGSVEAADSQGRRLSGLTGLAELGEIFGATSGGPEEVRLGEFGPGKYRIRATKSGYEPGETELSVGDLTPKTLEVRLEKK
jgi:protocatechuate 3,4-dioxygenase beta subunit